MLEVPLVSVKMITYNHAPYISRAIEGVLSQKVNYPIELVIGEDCSTDGTRDIVFDYQRKFPDIIRVITSDKNVGMKRNGYRTTKACRGKYLAFCEGDDYWHRQDKLEKQVKYMEENPDCGLVHSDYNRYFPETGKIIENFNRISNNIPKDNLDMAAILRGGKYIYILTCTVLVRKDMTSALIDADPFLYQSHHFMIGDTQLWAEIAMQSKTHYIDESLATYTVNKESASKSLDAVKKAKFGVSVNEVYMYLVRKHNLAKSEYNYHNANWCRLALELAFYERNQELANEAKKRKEALSLKERLYFMGTKNIILNKTINKLINLKRKITSVQMF